MEQEEIIDMLGTYQALLEFLSLLYVNIFAICISSRQTAKCVFSSSALKANNKGMTYGKIEVCHPFPYRQTIKVSLSSTDIRKTFDGPHSAAPLTLANGPELCPLPKKTFVVCRQTTKRTG